VPECATELDEAYDLAKTRGMDFVTLADHDTIDGVLALDHLPDTFVSGELTAWFGGEPQAVCCGITGRPRATTGPRNAEADRSGRARRCGAVGRR
jgi:predicted metal-dependent phosphoesterase TrpH